MRHAYGAPDAPALDAMSDAFVLMLNANPAYAQVRWNDPAGHERLRIDRTPHGAVRVPSPTTVSSGKRRAMTSPRR